MSYPPPINRQPLGIPQLPPGIPPPQFPGFAPTVPPGNLTGLDVGAFVSATFKSGWGKVCGVRSNLGRRPSSLFESDPAPGWMVEVRGLVPESGLGEKSRLICCDFRETRGFRFHKAGSAGPSRLPAAKLICSKTSPSFCCSSGLPGEEDLPPIGRFQPR